MGGGRGRPAFEVPEENIFGAWLRSKRTTRGYTGEVLSLRTNSAISQSSISHYERGTKKPEARSVVLLAEALGEDVGDALSVLAADTKDADPATLEALRKEALAASVGLSREIERVPVDDPDFWDAYEGAPQEDRELAKQLLIRARDRERARTIGGTGG